MFNKIIAVLLLLLIMLAFAADQVKAAPLLDGVMTAAQVQAMSLQPPKILRETSVKPTRSSMIEPLHLEPTQNYRDPDNPNIPEWLKVKYKKEPGVIRKEDANDQRLISIILYPL